MFCLIALDIAIIIVIESTYCLKHFEDKETIEQVLPPYIEYTLQGMLLFFIVFYIIFLVFVNRWFKGETMVT
jgi:hypothetical protein